jgi:hypothetical protein
MELVIKCFKTALKGCKDFSNKNISSGKCVCFKCGKTGHFKANYPNNENDQEKEKNAKGKKVEKKKLYKKNKGEAHIGKEWDSDCSPLTPTMKDTPPLHSTNPLSSPTRVTLASWQRRGRYSQEPLISILPLVMRIIVYCLRT